MSSALAVVLARLAAGEEVAPPEGAAPVESPAPLLPAGEPLQQLR